MATDNEPDKETQGHSKCDGEGYARNISAKTHQDEIRARTNVIEARRIARHEWTKDFTGRTGSEGAKKFSNDFHGPEDAMSSFKIE